MNKPAIELKKEIRNNFNNIFDKSKPLKERKNERFKLQNAIEQELMNTNIKTLQNIYILLKVLYPSFLNLNKNQKLLLLL